MSDAFYEQLSVWSQVAGSVVFLIALVYVWIKYLTPAVIASQARKNAELLEAEQRRDTAKSEIAVAQGELQGAHQEAASIGARGENDARKLHERILADSKAEGERLVRNAEGELERGRWAARESLRDELVHRALEIARESAAALGAQVDRRLVNGTLDTVERKAAN